MGTLVREQEESGGVVTTVRTETTSDLDVLARIKESQEGEEPTGDEDEVKPAAQAKPEKKKADTVKASAKEDEQDDEDDDDEKLDFNKLSPKQQKAVEKLYRERRQERREFRKLNSEIADLRAEIQAGNKRERPAPGADKDERPTGIQKPVRPKRTAFAEGEDGEDKYEQAMDIYDKAVYKYNRALELNESQTKEHKEAANAKIERFNEMAEEFIVDHDDYEEVMDEAKNGLTEMMFGHLVEFGPALGYYLAKNPKECARIAKLDTDAQDRALTRIEVKLEDEAEAAKKAKSKGKKKEDEDEDETPPPKPKKSDPPATVTGRSSPATVEAPKSFKDREKAMHKRNPGAFNYTP